MVLNGDPPYATGVEHLDVNGDGSIAPSDVLVIFNELTENGSGVFDPFRPGELVVYWDVNGDGFVTPIDPLIVINYLNINGAGPAPTPPVNNLPPVGFPMNFTVLEGTTTFFVGPFFDPERGPLNVVVGSDLVDGNLIRHGTTFSYQPGPFRQDVFSLIAVDNQGLSTEVTITVNVDLLPGPHAPSANDDVVTFVKNTPVFFDVLDNDTDVDGDNFDVVSHTLPEHGELIVVIADGTHGSETSFGFIPDVNFEGATSFSYTIRDATGLEDTASVFLAARHNTAPVALSPVINVTEDTPSPTFFPAELGSDLERDELSFVFGASTNGFIQRKEGGWEYIPNVNFRGTDTVGYSISDGFSTVNGVLTFVVIEPRFIGPNVSRAEAVYIVVELNGGVLSQHTAPTYQDVNLSDWSFPFVEEAVSEGWIQDGFAVGSNFFPNRSVTLGEMAKLIDEVFALPGEDFVSSVLDACVLTQAQSSRLADPASEEEFWEMLAKTDRGNACGVSESEIDQLARNLASQFGTTY